MGTILGCGKLMQTCIQHPVPSPYLYRLPSFFSLGQMQKPEQVLPAANASVFAPWHAHSLALGPLCIPSYYQNLLCFPRKARSHKMQKTGLEHL